MTTYRDPGGAMEALARARDQLVKAAAAMPELVPGGADDDWRNGPFPSLCGGLADAVDGAMGVLTELTRWEHDPFSGSAIPPRDDLADADDDDDDDDDPRGDECEPS